MNRQKLEPKILETRTKDDVDDDENEDISNQQTKKGNKKNKKKSKKNKGLKAFMDGDELNQFNNSAANENEK